MEVKAENTLKEIQKQLSAEQKTRRMAETKAKIAIQGAAARKSVAVEKEIEEDPLQSLGSVKSKKLSDSLRRIVNRKLTTGILALLENEGPCEYVPPGFHERLEEA